MARSTRRNAPSSKASNPTELPEGEPLDTSPKAKLEPISALKFLGLLVLAAGVGFGAFALWHRPKDIHRIYSAKVGAAYARKLEARLQRCFGASDAAGIRRSLEAVRGGRLPAPLDACRGPILSETLAAPFDFSADLLGPPPAAEHAQTQLRDALSNLGGSMRRYERVARGFEGSAVPEAQRAPLADALDDVANYTTQVANAVNDLRRVSENAAAPY